MDSFKYTEKCLGLLENDRFAKINNDPTKRIGSKFQKRVLKLKSKRGGFKTIPDVPIMTPLINFR